MSMSASMAMLRLDGAYMQIFTATKEFETDLSILKALEKSEATLEKSWFIQASY